MNYAVTIKDGIITGQHCSSLPITEETFENSSAYAGQTVRATPAMWLGIEGLHVNACDPETLEPKPLIWRIEHGYSLCPPGYELVDGALVKVDAPVAEQPESVRQMLGRIDMDAEAEQKASRVMFRALAQTDVITAADALDNAGMFPAWADCIGQRAEAGSYWRHGDKLYRVNAGQGHTIQADWAPDKAASLFSLAANPAEEWPEWIQPTGAHNAYAKGAKVTHSGKRWVSTADGNVWAPGTVGTEGLWVIAMG